MIRAKALFEIRRSATHLLVGCASVAELGARHGVRPWITQDLLRLGALLQRDPDLEPRFLAGDISLRAAGSLERILEVPDEAPAEWVPRALDLSTRDFCAEVRERLEERRIGRPPVHRLLRLSREGDDALRRARVIVSRKRQRVVGESETVEQVCFDYLERHDPLRRPRGRRRMPDTNEHPGRSVPREVDREVRRRDRERCQVPFCPNDVFLDRGHLQRHADGGSRESDNLILICSAHNQMMEKGFLFVRGTPEHPQFHDAAGRLLDRGGQSRKRAPPSRRITDSDGKAESPN
ncbi:MAG: hypothetical protein ACYTG6_04395 [Planctomycetota bacterium]